MICCSGRSSGRGADIVCFGAVAVHSGGGSSSSSGDGSVGRPCYSDVTVGWCGGLGCCCSCTCRERWDKSDGESVES